MKFNRMTYVTASIAALILTAAVLSCGKGGKKDTYVSFFSGSVTLQRNGAPAQVEVKGMVQEGDIFSIGENSMLILQTSDGLVVRFEPNTEAVISSINDITKREISLNKGKVLSSVEKLGKGHGYAVKTPTAVASVRGTQFLTEYNGKASIVAVGKGVVSVKRISGAADEKSVEKGNSAVVEAEKNTVDLREVNKVETLELSKLDKTPVVEDVEKKSPEELKGIYKETEKNDEEINVQIKEETGLTPAEMKAKYGRIDVITMYNGRVIQGVIVSRGASYRVLTSNGAINVNAKDVRRTDVR